jgi:saccharopine dehydrogenase (NAD+, L-lysine-forming)
MKFGIIREGKTPPDKRVPLSPQQCESFKHSYPNAELVVQPSAIRAFSDDSYTHSGITLQEDLTDCDVLLGVKEVPFDMLIPEKTYLFFSHTYKLQPYNSELLRTILDKKIRLIDYEVLTNAKGKRLIGFGRYAGVVGCYNGFLAYGKKTGRYELKQANLCADRVELNAELKKINVPADFKMVITGDGRVAGGALEIIEAAGLKRVSPDAYKNAQFDEPVYAQLLVSDYNERLDGSSFKRKDFYADPTPFRSSFMQFATGTHMYVPCHYWNSKSPYIFTREDAKSPDFDIKIVADVSCDIDCAVASTLRPSTISDPLYGYDATLEKEVDFMDENAIGVMAVDNLPCELPLDASEDFGNELLTHILPNFFNGDPEGVLARASETTLEGELTTSFAYLEDYAKG